MSGKWDFSSCFRQAGCSAHRQGRRAPLGVVWWELGPDASPGSGGWIGGPIRARWPGPRARSWLPSAAPLACGAPCSDSRVLPAAPGDRSRSQPPRTDEEAETPAAEVTCPRSLSH